MVTKSTAAKNAACNAVTDLIDQTSTGWFGWPSGRLQLYRSSDSSVIASLVCANPAFLPAIDGTSMANPISDATALLDGTATTFGFVNRDSTFVWGGTVGSDGSSELNLGSNVISSGTIVSVTSGRYIVP